jgi:hypothetical protein
MSTAATAPRGALVGAYARREEAAVEALGVGRGVERDRACGNPWRSIVVADAPNAENERVVRHGPLRQDLGLIVIDDTAKL